MTYASALHRMAKTTVTRTMRGLITATCGAETMRNGIMASPPKS